MRAIFCSLLAGLASLSLFVQSETRNPLLTKESSRTNQLVGTWRLVSREERLSNGKTSVDPSLGTTPVGYLMYDQSGHMAVQLMRRDRPTPALESDCKGTPQNGSNSSAIFGYDAYFGTYTVNGQEGTVTHHLEGALSPSDVGKDLKRSFTVSDDRLAIRLATNSPDGSRITRTLIWQRVN